MEERFPNFLTEVDQNEIPQEDIFVFVYAAGHGSASQEQYYLLNEDNVDKIFFPLEEKLRKYGQLGESNVKVVAVYDTSRGPYGPLRFKIELALEKAEEERKLAESEAETEPNQK